MEPWRSSWFGAPAGASTSRRRWSAIGCGCRSRAGCRSPTRRRRPRSWPNACGGASTRPAIDVVGAGPAPRPRVRPAAAEEGAVVGPPASALGFVHARGRDDPRLVAARGVPVVGARLRARARARAPARRAPRARARRRSSTASRWPSGPGASSIAKDLDPDDADECDEPPLLAGDVRP